jgi:hypothetical protein
MPSVRALLAGSLLVLLGACAKRAPSSDFADSPAGSRKAGRSAGVGEQLATSFGGAANSPAPAELEAKDEASARRADTAPSLGTAYGEERMSTVRTAPFERASSAPDTVLALFYDDVGGLRRRAGRSNDFGRLESRVTSEDGSLAVSLIDDRGRVIAATQIGDRRFALGTQGIAYRIGIENHARERFEAVASVDGLDVMDGSEASFAQRGYIVEPFTSMVVEGWRTSEDTVAAFRFSELEDSYAERTGRARNIGVVGVAFFREESAGAFRSGGADPFPGRFAPAPPRR